MLKYSPETEDFFRPRPKAEDEKNPRLRGHIVVYGLRRPHIYNIYTTLCYQTLTSYTIRESNGPLALRLRTTPRGINISLSLYMQRSNVTRETCNYIKTILTKYLQLNIYDSPPLAQISNSIYKY